jgi:hypothetical protein
MSRDMATHESRHRRHMHQSVAGDPGHRPGSRRWLRQYRRSGSIRWVERTVSGPVEALDLALGLRVARCPVLSAGPRARRAGTRSRCAPQAALDEQELRELEHAEHSRSAPEQRQRRGVLTPSPMTLSRYWTIVHEVSGGTIRRLRRQAPTRPLRGSRRGRAGEN